MPEDQQTQEQQLSPMEEDQARALAFQKQRDQDRVEQQQAEDEADEDEEGEEEDEGEGSQDEQSPPSLITYSLFGFFAVIIDVVIDAVGGFIFTAPITFALGILFKVPAYFFLTSAGKKEKLFAKRAVLAVCAVLNFLPGDNLATVLVSLFLDYKDKVLKVTGKAASLTGRKDIAKVASIAERASRGIDRVREREQTQGQEDGR